MVLRLGFGPLLAIFALAAGGSLGAAPADLPAWVDGVGARSQPAATPVYSANDYGADRSGAAVSTAAIQKAIDTCARSGGGTVAFAPGRYLTGALFVKSRVRLRVDAGVTLVATTDESAYPIQPTRVAGIEMSWPAGLINVDNQRDVEISGQGTIDGQGQFWWKKYWDLRRADTPRGLRWAADYDCQRVRLLVVWKSQDVTVEGLRLRRSGFWNVQLTYSDAVTVDGVTIADNFAVDGIRAASTDGVDVDSSRRVLVQRCDIDNNDDDICLKAGRDADGLRVNRPTEYVVIRDNICRRGGGVVSFGSETSGWIRHVVAYHDTGVGTSEGIRFKSTRTRGGGVEDVLIEDVTLQGVPRPFTFTLDWDPSYSTAKIPAGTANVPSYWKVMTAPVLPPERGYAQFRDIRLESIHAVGAKQILTASGGEATPLGSVLWSNVTASGETAGYIRWAHDWTMHEVHFTTADGQPAQLAHCNKVDSPAVSRESSSASL